LLALRACMEEGRRVNYHIEFKLRAVKDLKGFPKSARRRIMAAIESMKDDLTGDVKKLTNFTPEYRLRVGNYRALFEVDSDMVVI